MIVWVPTGILDSGRLVCPVWGASRLVFGAGCTVQRR